MLILRFERKPVVPANEAAGVRPVDAGGATGTPIVVWPWLLMEAAQPIAVPRINATTIQWIGFTIAPRRGHSPRRTLRHRSDNGHSAALERRLHEARGPNHTLAGRLCSIA